MGKKKSVVLMVLLTIVIVVLCAIAMIPSFTVPGTVDKWNPVVLQYDLGADLGGGYYAYYYPEGVITESEFISNGEDEDDYLKHKGLYLSTDEDAGIVENGAVAQSFKDAFNGAAKVISKRFEAKGYSDYTVSVVDDYAIRVDLPASAYDQNNTDVDKLSAAFTFFSNTGKVTLESGGALVEALEDEDARASELIKSVSVGTRYKTSYLKIKFTTAGKVMLQDLKDSLSDAPTSDTTDTSSLTTLDIKVGDEKIASIYKDNILSGDAEAQVYFVDEKNKDLLETYQILLSSALENGGYDVSFTAGSIRAYEPVYGENVLTLLYIALGVVLVALLVLPVIKMGRYGIVGSYLTLSYLIVTSICFAFISKTVFEITLGSVLVFLAGLVLMNVLHYITYNAIKKEFDLGKTVESSVKGGYNKTLWNTVDIYAVLLLGALALLIGAAGMNTLALQMIICIVTGAFCNLLWGRAINYTFLSASQNKYKYFRFVREDDDDE